MEEGMVGNRKVSFDWKIDGFLETIKETKYSPTFKIGRNDFQLFIDGRNNRCIRCEFYTPIYLHSKIFSAKLSGKTFYELCAIGRSGQKCIITQRKLCHHHILGYFLMVIQTCELLENRNDLFPGGTLSLHLSWWEEEDIVASEHDTQTTSDLTEERESNPCLEALSRDFSRLYESKVDTDCVLKVGKAEFPVHRQVLATRSEVFAAMFRHDTSECRSGVVDITDIDGVVLDDVLHYIYSGQTRGLTPDTAVSMYVVAEKYALFEMRDICLDLLKRSLTLQNVCEAAILAHTHEKMDLENAIVAFLEDKLVELKETNEWQNFLETKPSLANKLIRAAFMACKMKLSAK